MNYDWEFIRNKSPLGVEDKELDKWLNENFIKCHYCGMPASCNDHILGGYHGRKGNGLLKVRACYQCNLKAERDPKMHREALGQAVVNLLRYLHDKRT